MSTIRILLALSIYWKLCPSSPCIPANTCFEQSVGNDDYSDDTSVMYRCDSSHTVRKDVYIGTTTCDPNADLISTTVLTWDGNTGALNTAVGAINDGDEVVGSSSGAINTDYLKGANCPLLDSDSDTCTQYMILKHRGNEENKQDWEGVNVRRPYLNIGDNCTAYESDPSAFTQYDSILVPYGCVNQRVGSKRFDCGANGWSWTHYEDADCTGPVLTAQTESFVVNKCGYFSEWTHCDPPYEHLTTGCVGYGVHDWWWYWYDLVCCPQGGTPCEPGAEPSNAQTPTNPPTKAGGQTTPTATAKPTTKAPTTRAPTSPGTAKPTAPTTAAPTNTAGTAKPSSPTTAAPTSPGTARPTAPTTGAPTSADGVAMQSLMFPILYGLAVMTMELANLCND